MKLCKYSWKKYYYTVYKKFPWKEDLHQIKQSCNNSNNKAYKYYGGRGIKCLITEEEIKKLWYRDKAYKMKRPSIDRIDNDGNYEYNNCQFIEFSKNISKRNKQSSNKAIKQLTKDNKLIQEFISVKLASKMTKISYTSISKVALGKQKTAGGFKWGYKNAR